MTIEIPFDVVLEISTTLTTAIDRLDGAIENAPGLGDSEAVKQAVTLFTEKRKKLQKGSKALEDALKKL